KVDGRMTGSTGNFHSDRNRDDVRRYKGTEEDGNLRVRAGDGLYDCVGPVDSLVELALGTEPNRSPGELGARTVEILEAAYRSADSGTAEPVATLDRS